MLARPLLTVLVGSMLCLCTWLGAWKRLRVRSSETSLLEAPRAHLLSTDETSLRLQPSKPSTSSVFITVGDTISAGDAPDKLNNTTTATLSSAQSSRKALVVASLKGDDVSWLHEHFAEWELNIYVMDDPNADLTVDANKGHEGAAYLRTHDIPAREALPMAQRRQALHNASSNPYQSLSSNPIETDPMYDGLRMLQHFHLSHVNDVGFANLRCTWSLGCPHELSLSNLTSASDSSTTLTATPDNRDATEHAFLPAFRQLFPELTEPSEIGVPCGGQFAVSRAQVLKRPRSEYVRYSSWLRDTELDDAISGRVLEYSWHLIFHKPPVYCPSASECFCQKYGLCDLDCADQGDCGRYRLPSYSTIPEGWPNSGQEGLNGWPARDWWS